MADYVLLEKRLPWLSDISSEAYLFFHGWAERLGHPYPLREYQYGDDLEHRMVIIKNVFEMSDIFQPGLNLVVSERIRRRMAGASNVAFLPVEFGRVFSVPYELDQERYADLDGKELLEHFANDPSALRALGSWYELVVPHYDRVPDRLKTGGIKASVELESTSVALQLELTRELAVEYPIIWKESLLFSAELFAEIEEFADIRFFRRIPITLTRSQTPRS